MPLHPERIRRYVDGVVIFDPVTGVTSSLTSEGAEVIEALCDMIDGGVRDREALLDAARGELDEADLPSSLFTSAAWRENLGHWVDLALHLSQ